jgi:hypothetical protein
LSSCVEFYVRKISDVFLKWESPRFGTLTKFFSGHNFFCATFFWPSQYNHLNTTISIQPSLYNHLNTTISIQPLATTFSVQFFSGHLNTTISIQPSQYNHINTTISIQPSLYNHLYRTILSIQPSEYNHLNTTISIQPYQCNHILKHNTV